MGTLESQILAWQGSLIRKEVRSPKHRLDAQVQCGGKRQSYLTRKDSFVLNLVRQRVAMYMHLRVYPLRSVLGFL